MRLARALQAEAGHGSLRVGVRGVWRAAPRVGDVHVVTDWACVALRGRPASGGRGRREARGLWRAHGERLRRLPPQRPRTRSTAAPDPARRVGRDGGGRRATVPLPPDTTRASRSQGHALRRPTRNRLPRGCRARRAPSWRRRGLWREAAPPARPSGTTSSPDARTLQLGCHSGRRASLLQRRGRQAHSRGETPPPAASARRPAGALPPRPT